MIKQILIIPDKNHIDECLILADEYHLGFEYNDFFLPDVLDDEEKWTSIVKGYQKETLPAYATTHGAFLDVIPFSADARIREIANLRIEQSIEVAERIGAKAVVFHTNYVPFLNTKAYIENWVKTNIEYWGGVLGRHPDINIYLENMFDSYPDIMVALAEGLCKYENFGICLDWAHASLSKVKPEIWAERLGRYVKHIHINDNDMVSDLHLAWGDGVLNRVAFYECYEKYMKGATVLIETSLMENKIRSLEMLKKEGFI